MRVLISSAGRRVELLDCFRRAGERLGVPTEVVAADVQPDLSPACQLADAAVAVPPCDDPSFPSALLRACADTGAELVVPTIDPELAPLAAAAGEFSAAGVDVVVSDPAVVAIARDKQRTSVVLGEVVPVPASWLLAEADREALPYPVVVKPVGGSASVGLRFADGPADLPADADGLLVQRRLAGDEYTVNCYVTRGGDPLGVVPHRRIAVRGGEVAKGQVVCHPALLDAARRVVGRLPGLRGPLCFQAFVVGDRVEGVFEVNARFGGGYPLADAAGAPYAEWLLREHLGLPLPADVPIADGLLMLRYDRSTFVRR